MILPETVLHDMRYGIRALLRSPWSTAITILSLALGIGVNTAMVTGYKAFFMRQLDARNPDEMANIAVKRNSGVTEYLFSYPDYEAYRDNVRAFSGLAAHRNARVMLSEAGPMISQRTAHDESTVARLGLLLPSGAANAEFAQVYVVSENYFEVFGVSPIQGRTFSAVRADKAMTSPAVLISENYWRRRFASDPWIVGKTVRLNRIAVTIVGVTPRDFIGAHIATPAFWVPVSIEPLINGDSQWLTSSGNGRYRLFGRLAPDVSFDQAKAQIEPVAENLWKLENSQTKSVRLATKPASMLVWPGSPFPLPLSAFIEIMSAIGLIFFGGAMVLAVACANVGSLELARARSREAELRTRLSLGPSRARVIRQLLTESTVVAIVAGLLSLLVSWALLKVAVNVITDALPVQYGSLVFDVTPNLAVFGYIFLLSLIAGRLVGLTPAIQSPRSSLTSTGRSTTASVRGRRLQGLLVAVQVALTLALIITGTMFVRGAVNSLVLETGYDSKHLLQVDFQFANDPKYVAARKTGLINEVRIQLAALPGVSGSTIVRPPGADGFRTAAVALGGTGTAIAAPSILNYTYVQAGYFETLGISVLRGRRFQRQEEQSQSVILSESAARQVFGAENPLGRSIRMGPIDERRHPNNELVIAGPAYQVVGVARDTRGWSFDGSDSRQIYLLSDNDRLGERPLIIRTQSNPVPMIEGVERLIALIDPGIVVDASTLEDALRRSPPFIGSSLAAAASAGIGLLGLALALIGIFGTVSHIVALRTREVGIRIAVGAQKLDVLTLILREITRPVVGGLFVGMGLAAGVVYLLCGVLYGVNAVDSLYFVLVSILFYIVALMASYPPARRAMRVDPVVALRHE